MRFNLFFKTTMGALFTVAFAACASSDPTPLGSSLPPEATMSMELTDLQAPIPADGNLTFIQGYDSGPEGIAFKVLNGGEFGFSTGFSRERAGDLVAGRLVENTGLVSGAVVEATDARARDSLGPVKVRINGVDVIRQILNVRLTTQGDSAVVITAALGAPDGVGIPELPPTGTLTARGQLRLSCSLQPAPGTTGGVRMDPAFSSPYCAGLRTELGLDHLLAISNSI